MHLLYIGARDFIKFPAGESLTTIGFDADETANLNASRDICVCLGSEDSIEQQTLFVTKHPEWSSVFEPDTHYFNRTKGYINHGEIQLKEKTTISKLDTILSNLPAANNIKSIALVINAQGSSLAILQGSKAILPKIPLVIAELEVQQQYQNAPLYFETCSYLNDLGYILIDISLARTYRQPLINNLIGRGELSHGDWIFFSHECFSGLCTDEQYEGLVLLYNLGYISLVHSLISAHNLELSVVKMKSSGNQKMNSFQKTIFRVVKILSKNKNLKCFMFKAYCQLQPIKDVLINTVASGIYSHRKDSFRIDRHYFH